MHFLVPELQYARRGACGKLHVSAAFQVIVDILCATLKEISTSRNTASGRDANLGKVKRLTTHLKSLYIDKTVYHGIVVHQQEQVNVYL